jgi:hypothetical protein
VEQIFTVTRSHTWKFKSSAAFEPQLRPDLRMEKGNSKQSHTADCAMNWFDIPRLATWRCGNISDYVQE